MSARGWDRLLSVVALASVLVSPRTAFAETPASVALRLEGADTAETEPLRAAISRELPTGVSVAGTAGGAGAGGAGTTGPAARLTVVMRESSASVRYEGPDGRALERTIDLPTDPAKRRELVALLVANLVRDEASDLEAALRGPPRPPAAPPEPSAPTPPAVPPAAPPASDDPCAAPRDPQLFMLDAVPGVSFPPWGRTPPATVAVHGAFIGDFPGDVRGVSGSILLSYGRRGVCGVDVAGFGTHVAGKVSGAQIAGFGVWGADVRGYQAAPLAIARNTLVGVQTGVLAIAGHSRGAQVSSVNLALSMEGLQVGALSYARGRAVAQVGALNYGGDAVFQLGAVNIARRSGVAIGAANIAEEAEVPIGVVNVIRNGRTHVDALAWDYGGVSGELVHGGKYAHAIQGIGARRGGKDSALPFFYLGMGGHIPVSPTGRGPLRAIDVDVLTYFFPGERFRANTQLHQLRVLGSVPLFGVSILLGPTLNVSLAPNETSKLSPFAGSFVDRGRSQTVRVWTGLSAGLRFF